MGRSFLLLLSMSSALAATACVHTHSAIAQVTGAVSTPASVIGHEVGADYKLARWETIVSYFEQLAKSSDRVNVRRIGTSTEGQPYILSEISSADTVRNLDKYRRYQAKLGDPRKIDGDGERADLLREAKTTIVVTFGLHSNECAGSQAAMEIAYELATGDDARTREILDNCIILLVPSANPDGNNKIIDWYERYLGTPYEGGRMPWLYQKYAGHDDNRDWFMLNLKETRILTKILYHEWFPAISYDVHQMGNRGARFFVPPFFDPVNPNVDPLIHQSLLLVGGHMATELQENGKTGVIYKAIFDNWWQGGNRTTPYRHNIVGILTEAASAKIATPIFQDYRELRGGGRGFPAYQPAVNFPAPWPGGWWRLRDIVEYEKLACRGLFTLAARYRDHFVRNQLTLGEKALRLGREEPPYAWLVTPNQHDPGSAAHMLEVLRLGGIEVHTATVPFTADGMEYPEGTSVMLAEQPYRAHLKDMMERQVLPDRRAYPGGPPEAPYDSAGWTLPLQMGVKAVEVMAPFEASLKRLHKIQALGSMPDVPNANQYITRRQRNADFAAVNTLLNEGYDVSVLTSAHGDFSPGSLLVSGGAKDNKLTSRIKSITQDIPARFEQVKLDLDKASVRKMTRPRTALYQSWVASMDEGWTRLILENFNFPYTTIHNAEIRAGSLRSRFDCIIMPSQSLRRLLDGASDKDMPLPYAGGIGLDGAMALERFVEQGGTLILMDSATELATELLHVPVRNVLKNVSRDDFLCPGSILRLRVDNTQPLGYGFGTEAAAMFVRSRAFDISRAALSPKPTHATNSNKNKTNGGSRSKNIVSQHDRKLTAEEITAKLAAHPVTSSATYADNMILLSGWIFGEKYIRNRTAVCEVKYGEGQLVLFGFRVQFRGQPHNTFKFLFNAIYRSTLEDPA